MTLTLQEKFESEWADYINGLMRLDRNLTSISDSKKLLAHIKGLKKLAKKAAIVAGHIKRSEEEIALHPQL